MSDYKASITDLYKLRSTLGSLQNEYNLLLLRLTKKEEPLLRERVRKVGMAIAETRNEINKSILLLYADPDTDPLLQIDEANPVLLLPLRLETRFARSGDELWIRVYPDEISIHTHEAALTDSESKAGSYYWKYLWKNTNTPPDFDTHRKKAWSQVANRFGVNRATWIFLKTRPLKLGADDDFSNILAETDLDPGPIEKKDKAWSEAAKSYVMPDILK
ncbi:MAG: hypothetical protein ABI688_11315, partial [Bacteroidota bacterium]